MTVGELIRQQRIARGLSARSLSLASGVSDSVVGKVEAGSCQPSLRVFARIAVELKFTHREIAMLVWLAAQDQSGT